MTISEGLKRLRRENNLTQAEFVSKVGMVLKTYQQYEQGKVTPPSDVIVKLAQHYHVSADYVMGLSDCKRIENDMICNMTGLAPSAIETLVGYQHTAAIEKNIRETKMNDHAPAALYSTIPNTISFLLRPENCDVVNLIGTFITSDDIKLSEDLPPVLRTTNYNGSGISFDTADLLKSALPNMIQLRLNDLRVQRKKAQKKQP